MSAPAISMVLVTDEFATVRKTVEHLSGQSEAARIEVVVVHPAGVPLDVDGAAAGLWALVPVETRSVESLPEARAAGARASRAPLVAFGETHSYPQPGWAESLLAAHERDVAAVGPAVTCANPGSAIAWANVLIDYGPWLEADEAGPRPDLPGHNSSYKRDVLFGHDDALAQLLANEFVLHERLRDGGHVLWLEPSMRIAHLNVSDPRTWLPERYWAARLFSATRARDWPLRRRLLHALGAPLIPVVRTYRIVPNWRRARRRQRLPWRVVPAVLLGLVLSATGELAGCVAGEGPAATRLSELELHRERYAS